MTAKESTALVIPQKIVPSRTEVAARPAAGGGSNGGGGENIRGWDEAVRRPEDGKLVEGFNSSLLLENSGNNLISPFSLFNMVQFPNLECPTDTGM